MASVKRLYVASASFGIAAAACLLVGYLRRNSVQDALGSFEGAYLNRAVGHPKFEAQFSGHVLSPIHPLNAYLWIGAGLAFAVAGLVVVVLARLAKG